MPEELQICPICNHGYPARDMTKHHLVPKSRGGRETEDICRHCHKQIHALFTEKELERNYPTVDALKESEEIQNWMNWVRKRRPTGRVYTRKSRRIRK